ncbi:MAG: DUF4292 domain-containing protein [Flavobacteriales bacterium]
MYRLIFIILMGLLMFTQACRTKRFKKKFTPIPEIVADLQSDTLSSSNIDSTLASIYGNDLKFRYFSAKVNAEASFDKQKNTFSANLRIVKDSLIWAAITPALGIEVARVLIRPDSVFFINRINGTYFSGDFRYINELLKIETNYRMMEAILLANVYLHYPEDKYGYASIDNTLLLSSLRKRKLKRETELNLPEILFQELYFTKDSGKLQRLFIQDFKPIRKFEANYFTFERVNDQAVPIRFNINASAEKTANIEIEYSKITLDKVVNTPFNIPSGYERIR